MSLYSDFAPRRTAQIVADVVALVVVVLAVVAGVAVWNVIALFGQAWGRLEDAGTGFEGTMVDIGESLGGVPFVGNGIRELFGSAAGAGGSLAEAGRTGRSVIETLAAVAGVGVALLPIAILLLVWLWPRLRFMRRAAETRALLALGDGELLLALRALDSASAKELAAISPHPLRAWRDGDEATIHALAALEARAVGIRMPGRAATGAS